MCDEIGAANCSLRNASNPSFWTWDISSSVAPKVACERKRAASCGLGVPDASGGGGVGTGMTCAPVDKLNHPLISPLGKVSEWRLRSVSPAVIDWTMSGRVLYVVGAKVR